MSTETSPRRLRPHFTPEPHRWIRPFGAPLPYCRRVKRIELASGAVETLWTPPPDLANAESHIFAGDWNDRGDILFSWVDLYLLRRGGGNPELVATHRPEDVEIVCGQWLPDGRHYLFHARNRASGRGAVFAGTLGFAERVSILPSDSPVVYIEPGCLLFMQSGGLFAQRFDAARLSLVGEPARLVGGAETSPWPRISYWASKRTAAFARGLTGRGQLTWFDRSGREAGRVGDPLPILSFDLSRDGMRVVASVGAWRSARLRLIETRAQSPAFWLTDGPQDYDPRFNYEGDAVVFTGQDQRGQGLFQRLIHDRTVLPMLVQKIEQLNKMNSRIVLQDWSRDGRLLLYGPGSTGDWLRVAPVADVSRAQVVVEEFGYLDQARFSPDGRWIAFNSCTRADDALATFQVFVSSLPPHGEPRRITTHGGVQPLWRADGRELYYLDPAGNLMAVDMTPT